MDSERRRQRVRDVRHRLAHDGPPWTRDHADDFETVTVPERDCDALRDLLIAEGVETIVEVGLAYGRSALAIGEALVAVGARRPLHVIIDPMQATEWSNVGWQLLRSAGLDTIARVVPGAFDHGTVDQETGRPRMRALRLPDPPSEPAFERFQPF
jgi:hypothetical protein